MEQLDARKALLLSTAFTLILCQDVSTTADTSLHLDVIFRDFAEVSNLWQVMKFLAEKALDHDPDMARILDYLHSKDFKAINDYLWNVKEFKDFYYWTLANDLRSDLSYKALYFWLDWGPFPHGNGGAVPLPGEPSLPWHTDPAGALQRPKRSLKSLYEETVELIPYKDILTWQLEQLATNPDMTGLLEKLGENSTQHIVEELYMCPEFLTLRCTLIDEDFDIASREEMLTAFLEWEDFEAPKCK